MPSQTHILSIAGKPSAISQPGTSTPTKLRRWTGSGAGVPGGIQSEINKLFRTTPEGTRPLPHIMDEVDVTKNLGLQNTDEQKIQDILTRTSADFGSSPHLRVQRIQHARSRLADFMHATKRIPSDVRMEINRRALVWWRKFGKTDYEGKPMIRHVVTKAQVESPSLLKAGGPYIGPRGGKWADPGHTISWHEYSKKAKAAYGAVHRFVKTKRGKKPSEKQVTDAFRVIHQERDLDVLKFAIAFAEDQGGNESYKWGDLLEGFRNKYKEVSGDLNWRARNSRITQKEKNLHKRHPVNERSLEIYLERSQNPTLLKAGHPRGGPFIGPRGGKWADAARTVPWKDWMTATQDTKRKKPAKKKSKHLFSNDHHAATMQFDLMLRKEAGLSEFSGGKYTVGGQGDEGNVYSIGSGDDLPKIKRGLKRVTDLAIADGRKHDWYFSHPTMGLMSLIVWRSGNDGPVHTLDVYEMSSDKPKDKSSSKELAVIEQWRHGQSKAPTHNQMKNALVSIEKMPRSTKVSQVMADATGAIMMHAEHMAGAAKWGSAGHSKWMALYHRAVLTVPGKKYNPSASLKVRKGFRTALLSKAGIQDVKRYAAGEGGGGGGGSMTKFGQLPKPAPRGGHPEAKASGGGGGGGGGPYIGPKGGKWADPDHTIPWKEGGHGGAKHTAPDEKEQAHGIEDGEDGEGTDIPEFKFRITGKDHEQMAAQIKAGVTSATDMCKLSPPMCHENLGISRADMPQLDDDVLPAFLKSYQDKGVSVKKGSVEVGRLKATQKEISAEKATGMAGAYKEGSYDPSKKPIIISKDGYVLDGHHRWAAMVVTDPASTMRVYQVDTDIHTLLKDAGSFEGVKQAAFGKEVGDTAQPQPGPGKDEGGVVRTSPEDKAGLDQQRAGMATPEDKFKVVNKAIWMQALGAAKRDSFLRR